MFLTTVRVRRARPTTLDGALTAREQKQTRDFIDEDREHRGVVEVLVHGELQAIATVDTKGTVTANVISTRKPLVDLVSAAIVQTLVEASVMSMRAGEKIADELDREATSGRGRAQRAAGRD